MENLTRVSCQTIRDHILMNKSTARSSLRDALCAVSIEIYIGAPAALTHR